VVTVQDDGRGLPAGFDPRTGGNLGLQIVRTLVEGELGGTFDMVPAPERGTQVILDIPVLAQK
jgi:two-component sensor histidine kinase